MKIHTLKMRKTWMPLMYHQGNQTLNFKVLVPVPVGHSKPSEAVAKKVANRAMALEKQYPLPLNYSIN